MKILKGVVIFLFVTLMVSCNYNSSIMMKTDKDYSYDPAPSDSSSEYVISPSDIIEFQLFTNEGNQLIDATAVAEKEKKGSIDIGATLQYLIEFNGEVKLPLIGRVNLKGKTVKQVENFLEDEYSKFYIKPFVQLKVLNRRVTIFPGGSGSARVVNLTNENMNLIEALGQVGGLTDLAKAKRIKLIRGDLKNPKVFLFDFTTIEGIKEADFVLQANDIVYVEPRTEIVSKVIRDITPVLSLVVSVLTLILVVNNFNK